MECSYNVGDGGGTSREIMSDPAIMAAMGLTANMVDAIICQVAAALANSWFVHVAVGEILASGHFEKYEDT